VKDPLLRVLMVEDSADDVDLFSLALKRYPPCMELSIIGDGEEAINYLKRFHSQGADLPNLVLLDLNLPKKHGSEVLREMKADRKLRLIPVIVFSTSNAPSDVMNAYEIGATGYFVKPDSFERLTQFIHTCCEFWRQAEFPPFSAFNQMIGIDRGK
jgi:two-component system, chemotaxis family, response regulator Rcp1